MTTRAELDPLNFRDGQSLTVVEVQADALNNMADQLARDTRVRRASNSAIIACGRAIFTPGRSAACGFGAERRGLFGQDRTEPVELVPAVALVDSIQDMTGQMDTLETGLPAMIVEQDAKLAELNQRRAEGAVSQAEFDMEVAQINRTRARIADALAVTAAQAEQANINMQTASRRGQVGLGWHLSATAQLAQEAKVARAQLGLLEGPAPAPQDYVASNLNAYASDAAITHVPRSGEFR
ncbi:hypothetical protein ACERZ8_06320 [Tateyamaria armeniaca]|uniref:Uncharacterized protein n=1 Tax=Tateyamaria armeniaca TaxID=2518930 RepID=A0ABW8UQY0_9RHOB